MERQRSARPMQKAGFPRQTVLDHPAGFVGSVLAVQAGRLVWGSVSMSRCRASLTFVGLVSCAAVAAEPSLIPTRETLFGGSVAYRGEPAANGVIVLNANNGFFDKGAFRAEGKQPVPADDSKLISSHFTHLVSTGKTEGALRWYVWTPKAGTIDVSIYVDVPRSDVGQQWVVAIDGEEQPFRLSVGSKDSPQEQVLSFPVQGGAKHAIALRRKDSRLSSKARVYGLVLRGNAIRSASLLRARWRPAAVHTQYHSNTCPTTRMWVFESQNVSDVASYSPMTTRFGYFGGSFSSARTAEPGINFSMWASNRNAKAAPPLDQMPHLLATGSPEAEFSGFGHEGSGVKIRNWEPNAHRPKSIIQALRVDTSGGYDTFTGYLYNEPSERWVLFAQGRTPTKSKQAGQPTSLRPNSFCEVPGPPEVERTGDQRRAIRRRGWFYGDEGRWHAVDRQTVALKRGEAPINKFIGIDDDGWFVMGTGGMEMLEGRTEVTRAAGRSTMRPAYLQPDKVEQLLSLPVGIGDSDVQEVTADEAVVSYELSDLGPTATATVYYGPKDCVTFIPRELHGTERKGLSSAFLASDRTWQSATRPTAVSNGVNEFSLTELQAGQTYYYRVLVIDDDGKVWSDETETFATR